MEAVESEIEERHRRRKHKTQTTYVERNTPTNKNKLTLKFVKTKLSLNPKTNQAN